MIYEATKPEDIPAHGRLLGVKLLHDLSNLVEDNIDPQHTPGSEDERTAIEVAYYSRASYHGYDGYVTSHPDADSLGAIALLTDKRFLNMGISKRVERIADGEAFRSVEPDMMFYAINQMCMNQRLPLAERLECMRAYLFEGTIPPQIENSRFTGKISVQELYAFRTKTNMITETDLSNLLGLVCDTTSPSMEDSVPVYRLDIVANQLRHYRPFIEAVIGRHP